MAIESGEGDRVEGVPYDHGGVSGTYHAGSNLLESVVFTQVPWGGRAAWGEAGAKRTEAIGIAACKFDDDGQLIFGECEITATHSYTGGLRLGQFHGFGTEYDGDTASYDGELVVYKGHFEGGRQRGCGVEFINERFAVGGVYENDELLDAGMPIARRGFSADVVRQLKEIYPHDTLWEQVDGEQEDGDDEEQNGDLNIDGDGDGGGDDDDGEEQPESDSGRAEEQSAEEMGDDPAVLDPSRTVRPSPSRSATRSSSKPVNFSARLLTVVPGGAFVDQVRVLPDSPPGAGVQVIFSTSPCTWVKLDAAGTEAKLLNSLARSGTIKRKLVLARKHPGKAIGSLAGSRATRNTAFMAGYHDRTIVATATLPEFTYCVQGSLANIFGWSTDNPVVLLLKEKLGERVENWVKTTAREVNGDANIPFELQKMGMPRDASSTPALCLAWVVGEIAKAVGEGRDLHYIVETKDAETGTGGHVIAVTTNVGKHGAAICSDPEFKFPLLFAAGDVAETVARLKWWGAGGFIVGRRVVTNIYELAAADSGCSPPPRKKRKRGGFTAKALASQGAGDGGGGTGGESASGSSIAARLLA